jgi:hypothetical protein
MMTSQHGNEIEICYAIINIFQIPWGFIYIAQSLFNNENESYWDKKEYLIDFAVWNTPHDQRI